MKKIDKSKYKFCMILFDDKGNFIDSEYHKTLHSVSKSTLNLISRPDYRQICGVSILIIHNLT